MLKIRYAPVGKSTVEELRGLYDLLGEEDFIKRYIIDESEKIPERSEIYSKRFNKLKTYYKWNHEGRQGYCLRDMGSFDLSDIKEMREKYSFLYIEDKKGRVLGYLCFETKNLLDPTDDGISTIHIVKHMYISNELNCMARVGNFYSLKIKYNYEKFLVPFSLDYLLFYILENLEKKSIVYSSILYRPVSLFNNYKYIGTFNYSKPEGGIKVAKSNKEVENIMSIIREGYKV